jgi:hypothetical protein
MNGADAAVGQGPRAVGHLVVDVAGREHRRGRARHGEGGVFFRFGACVEAIFCCVLVFTRNASLREGPESRDNTLTYTKIGAFRVFFSPLTPPGQNSRLNEA